MLGLDYSSSDEGDGDSCAVNHDGEERREEDCSDVVRCKQDNATVPSSPALEQREEMEEKEASSPLNGLPVSKSKDRSTNVIYSAEKVNSETLAKCKQYLDIPNFDLTESIRNKKEFGNPHILDVVVDHFKIDEIGSNYPKDIFDPHGYRECDYEDGIRRFHTQAQQVVASGGVGINILPRVSSSNSLGSTDSFQSNISTVTSSCPVSSSLTSASNSETSRTFVSSVTGKKRKSRFSKAGV